jgi:hypothetical protein
MEKEKLCIIDTSESYCHSDRINAVFRDKIHDCDAFEIINHNETSWTASRVGIVALKGWAYGTGKPVYEIDANGKRKAVDIKHLKPYYNADFKVTVKK